MKNDYQICNLLLLSVLALILSACAGPGGVAATGAVTPSAAGVATATLAPAVTTTPVATLPPASSFTPVASRTTATLTDVPTPVPLPTRTAPPRPTATVTNTVRALPTIVCDVKGIIQISNTTNAVVELHLTGTGPYLFYLKPGDNALEVCEGQYNYLAYGCGGESASGAMSTGETHEFYCK